MHKKNLAWAVMLGGWVVALSMVMSTTAEASWVILKNGSFIRGEIEERANGQARIRLHDGGGIRTVPDDAILAVEAEMPFNDRLAAGNRELARSPANFEAAYRHFFIATHEQRRNPDANLGYILALDGLGRTPEALNRAREMTILNPAHARLKILYGELLSKTGEYDRAARIIRDAAALEPLNQGVQQLASEAAARNNQRRSNRAPNPDSNPGGGPTPAVPRFDRTMGNTPEAAEMALELLNWARSPDDDHTAAFLSGLLQLNASPDAERLLARGRVDEYRTMVNEAVLTVKADEEKWLAIKPPIATYARPGPDENLRERKLTLLGWYYQLKRRYPNATIRLVVTVERRGRRDPVTAATARWDGRMDRVIFEFDEPNR